ncbi:hypothetical protein HDV02_000756 [Globomyces sp. JEL0801]|nr:hypothetical protein HDV02_000756 [Globomyces sp. JEL0801]
MRSRNFKQQLSIEVPLFIKDLDLLHSPDHANVSPYENGPALIIPGLFLGCQAVALNSTLLSKLSIRNVINVAKEVQCPLSPTVDEFTLSPIVQLQTPPTSESSFNLSPVFNRYKFDWTHSQDILPVIDDIITLMHEMLISKQPILIHCHQGVSRSAALVIGYLMKIYKMTCHDAYNLVKDRAPSISPNVSLIAQLVECEKKWIG